MSCPPVFIVNLKQSVDRRVHMEQVLSSLPLEYEFVEAVDGRVLTDGYLKEVYDEKACIRNIGRPLSRGEVACALSHVKIWEMIKGRGLEEAFIMEDDICIKDTQAFIDILSQNNRGRYPSKWELILFAHGNSKIVGHGTKTLSFCRRHIHDSYEICRFKAIAWGTLGYLINQRGVKRLLEVIKPLRSTIDDGYTGNIRMVNLYGIEPILIEEDDVFVKNSTISKDREISRKHYPINRVNIPHRVNIPQKILKKILGIVTILYMHIVYRLRL